MKLSLEKIKKFLRSKLVSIILPTYNRGEKCVKVIQDVLNQTYKNIELIIVNDGSDDRNSKIIEDFIKNNKKISYIKHPNKGISASLNSGLEKVKGDFVTWISDDNIISNNFIEELVKPNSDFTYSNYNIFLSNGDKYLVHNKHSNVLDLINNFRGMAAFLWKKEMIDKIGKFNISLSNMVEDYDYEIRTFLLTENITHIDKVLIDFYQGENTQSSQNYTKMKEAHAEVKLFYNFYLKNLKSTNRKMEIHNGDKFVLNNDKLLVPMKYKELLTNILPQYDKKVSIVMAYYNRKKQTIKTLDGFEKIYSTKYNFEVVIVDDNSREEENLDDVVQNYSFEIKLIKIGKEEKGDRINPCSAYNKGFLNATGEIVIIQNPECYHIGDIIGHSLKNLKEGDYFSYSCFTANNDDITNCLINSTDPFHLINNSEFKSKNQTNECGLNWYNHPTEPGRNVGYHFCSSIYKSKLDLIGGFDERFAKGYCFDDDELLLSIKYNLKLNIQIVEPKNCFVVHQYHTRNPSFNIDMKDDDNIIKKKWLKNKKLFEEIKSSHEKTNFEYPKIIYLYWDGSPLTYLNYLTVISFNKFNKNWKINIFIPIQKCETVSWKTSEQSIKYNEKSYFDKLYNIDNVFIQKIDFSKIGFDNSVSEVIKSDYFRYYILEKHGGLWSDFDILYTGNVEEKMNFTENSVVFYCRDKNYSYFPVGLFLTKPNSIFFQHILELCQKIKNYDNYQVLGAQLFGKSFQNLEGIMKIDKNIKICNNDCYLPWNWDELDDMLTNKENKLPEKNVGIHWFNGAPKMKQYQIELEKRMTNFKYNSFFDSLIGEYIKSNQYEILKEKKEDLINNIEKFFEHQVINKLENIYTSIVMTSNERSKQTYFTLKTINDRTRDKNVQVILVDDSLVDPILPEKLNFPNLQINLIKIKNKNWVNPVVNYNIGFRFIEGEKIVIQNAEVCHVGNTIEYINNLQDTYNNYYILDVKNSPTFEINEKIYQNYDELKNTDIFRNINIFSNQTDESWHQHHKLRNYRMHFLTFMDKETFLKVKEFSYDYCYGSAYDDNDWLLNIVSKRINLINIDNEKICIGGIHLYHKQNNLNDINLSNRDLYMRKLMFYNETKIYVDFTKEYNTNYIKFDNALEINYNLELRETKKFYNGLNEISNDIKLTILVPTVPSRINYFYPKIMNELIKQIDNRKDIELLALFDNKKRSIGSKRQEMLNLAQGKYVTFIDDDDRIDENYIDEIMNCIYANKGVDCIVYDVICFNNETKELLNCKYGIEFEYGKISDTEWRGKPSHTMIWKSEVAKKYKYNNLQNGEDFDWVKRACGEIKKQLRIDKVLYYYDANYSTTSETANLSDETIKKNIKIMQNK